MRVDRVEPLVDFADAVRVLFVLGFRKQRRALGRRRKHVVERRHLAAGCFLREIADARRRRRLDPATIGLECPCDNFQQRGFAGAVATDEPDAGFRRQRCGGAIENEVVQEEAPTGVDNRELAT